MESSDAGLYWGSESTLGANTTDAIQGAELYSQNRFATLDNSLIVETKTWSGFTGPMKLEYIHHCDKQMYVTSLKS